jgi:high-affinity nickel permease
LIVHQTFKVPVSADFFVILNIYLIYRYFSVIGTTLNCLIRFLIGVVGCDILGLLDQQLKMSDHLKRTLKSYQSNYPISVNLEPKRCFEKTWSFEKTILIFETS